jgi:hypothetical protein
MAAALQDIADLYQQHIFEAGKQPHFLILVSFLLTFVVVRAVTHAIRSRRVRFLRDLTRGGTHIHHLVWGIFLLLATGYSAIAFNPKGAWDTLAILFGVGAALTLDEFALWLRLEDVYWTKEGRSSVDAVVIVAVVLALLVVGQSFWVDLGGLIAGFLRLV